MLTPKTCRTLRGALVRDTDLHNDVLHLTN